MQRFGILKQLDWAILRSGLIKLIIAIPIFSIILILWRYGDVLEVLIHQYIVQFLTYIRVVGNNSDDLATFLSKTFLLLAPILSLIAFFFVLSFRNMGKFLRRLSRSFWIGAFLLILGFAFISTSLFTIAYVTPEESVLPFLSDLFAGLGTEITGALLLFILLEVFAKTWEENEEAENVDIKQSNLNSSQEKLKEILAQWEQIQQSYTEKAETVSKQSLLNRLLLPQQVPAAYYEGQTQALTFAIQDLRQIINEISTSSS